MTLPSHHDGTQTLPFARFPCFPNIFEPPPIQYHDAALSQAPPHQQSRNTTDICTVQAINGSRQCIFRCAIRCCRGKTFSRWTDFFRHYNGAHAPDKTVFWCPVADCSRHEGRRSRPFPRKDKMMDHVAKKHGLVGGNEAGELEN